MADNETGLMSWAEIARHLGVSETTVKKRYASALRKLRREMHRSGITEEEFRLYLKIRTEDVDYR